MKSKKNQAEENGVITVKPKKKKKVLIIVLVIVALLAAVIGTAIHNMSKQVEMIANTVEVEPVQKRDLSDTISLKGTVAGESKTNVMSLAAAEITAVDVQVGDIVAEGDSLVTLDRQDIEKQIAELEKSISNNAMLDKYNDKDLQNALENAKTAQAQSLEDGVEAVQRAKKAYDDAKNSVIAEMIKAQQEAATEEERQAWVKKTQDYVNGGYKNDASLNALQQGIDDAEKAYERLMVSTNQSVEAAQDAIDKSKYMTDDTASKGKDTLDELKKQLADCELKAPTGGVVVAVNVSVGDKNTPGQTMITIENTSALKMVASVEEADILKLQEGMNANVTSDATGEQEIKGTVTRVVRVKSQSTGASGDTGAAAGGYSVEISLDTTELLVGMSVKAKVMLKEKGEVLAVPYDLIQYDESGNAYVLVAETDETGSAIAVKKNIEVGEEVDYYTEITGGDLKEGDMMIYDYSFSVTEGQTFTPEQMYSNQTLEAGAISGTDAEGVEQ